MSSSSEPKNLQQGAGASTPIVAPILKPQKTVTVTTESNSIFGGKEKTTVTVTAPGDEVFKFNFYKPFGGIFQCPEDEIKPADFAPLVDSIHKMHQTPATGPEHLAARATMTQGAHGVMAAYHHRAKYNKFLYSPVVGIGLLGAMAGVAGVAYMMSGPSNNKDTADTRDRKN